MFTKLDKKIMFVSLAVGVLTTGLLYSTEPEDKAQANNTSNKSAIHTVSKGDTLWAISRVNNVQLDALMAKNKLTSDLIHPGDKLSIPTEEAAEEPIKDSKQTVYGNDLTDKQYETLLMVVQQESGGQDYDATLAVMSVITNRIDAGWYQDSVWGVITARGQFEAYGAGHYLRHQGKVTDITKQAVKDGLNGKKNVTVVNFWSDWYYNESGRYDAEAITIGGNTFFNL